MLHFLKASIIGLLKDRTTIFYNLKNLEMIYIENPRTVEATLTARQSRGMGRSIRCYEDAVGGVM